MSDGLLIGLDLGTTAVKGVLIGLDGVVRDRFAERFPTMREGARVEQDPADWLRLVEAALARFAPAAGEVRAIGLCSQVNTHVFSDRAGRPLCPAIVWQDTRPADAAAAIDAKVAEADRLAWWGAPLPIDASHALARMAWVMAEEPARWSETARVYAPKDWVIRQLTGADGADPVASVGLVDLALAYVDPLIAEVPGAAGRLPPLADPLSPAGEVASGPFSGVPLMRGTMDAWAGLFGVGAAEHGDGVWLSGTSEVLGLISPVRQGAPGVIAFPTWRDITLHAGPTQAGGASFEWVAKLLGQPMEALAALAADARPGPIFLPHLQGERAPIWDPAARGAFAGLDAASGPGELARAVMEGVAFSARWVFEALEASAGGTVPQRIRLGGGGARSDLWCQIRADALGRPLERAAAPDAGAVGAAILAGVGVGALPDLATASRALAPTERVFVPDPARAAEASARYRIFRQFYEALRPVNAGLTVL